MIVRIIFRAIALRVFGTPRSTRCDFLSVDAAEMTPQEFEAAAWKRPVLLLNAFSWDERSGSQAAFLDAFGNVTAFTTPKVELQSREEIMPQAKKTTFGAWVSKLGHPEGVPFVFNWCSREPECAQRLATFFEIPSVMQRLVRKLFLSAGSEARGISFHNHGATWAALLAGSKTWVVAPPDQRLPVEPSDADE
jgi:hypothetical protein